MSNINLSRIQFFSIILIALVVIINLVVSIKFYTSIDKVSTATIVSYGDSGHWDAPNQPEWLKTPMWLTK